MPKKKPALVEVNYNFSKQSLDVDIIMKHSGFVLGDNTHAEIFDKKSNAHSSTYNQIWVRDNLPTNYVLIL